MNRLKQKYIEVIKPQLKQEFGAKADLAVPRLLKVVVSTGIGMKEANRDKAFESMTEQLKTICGQAPKKTRAKQSIAGFKTRQGDPLGLMVTLRGDLMWEFMDKLISVVLPRVKDFRGISRTAFDQNGNYNLGITEQIVFPEIEYDKIDRIRGLQVTVVSSGKNKEQAFRLLELMGMPFAKEQ